MGNVREMKDTCVAYGCFDGVHKGHLAVAKKVVEAAKEKGLVRLEGKDYVVQDGDIILFRFNV